MGHKEGRHESRKSIWRRLGRCLPYLRPYKASVAAVVAITVVSSGLPAIEPLGHRAIFDRLGGVAGRALDARALAWPVLFLAALWALRYVFDLVSALVAWRVRLAVHRDLLAE